MQLFSLILWPTPVLITSQNLSWHSFWSRAVANLLNYQYKFIGGGGLLEGN